MAEPPDDAWPVGWEDAADRVFEAGMAATPAQRLEWLEAAIEFAFVAKSRGESCAPPGRADADDLA